MIIHLRKVFWIVHIFAFVVNHACAMSEPHGVDSHGSVTGPEHASPGLIAQLYCSVLGSQDARFEYCALAHQALDELGIEKPNTVPIKQMNGIGPACARVPLSTFTAFGIWLDEPYLDSCSPAEKTFHLYHEAAHYALMHHQKLLAGIGITLLLLSIGLLELKGVAWRVTPLVENIAALGAGVLLTFGCYRYILPHIIKKQEKRADILAAQTLMAHGQQAVVVEHIDHLSKLSTTDDNALWWYSNAEQIAYLKAVISV